MKKDYAARARALMGTPFRPQGRGTGGLDCVGLAMRVFDVPEQDVRRDYPLHGDHERELRRGLKDRFRRVPPSSLRAGDLLLMRVAADQLHLAIRSEGGFVHAHARLRRVVETPGMPEWPILAIYRKRTR